MRVRVENGRVVLDNTAEVQTPVGRTRLCQVRRERKEGGLVCRDLLTSSSIFSRKPTIRQPHTTIHPPYSLHYTVYLKKVGSSTCYFMLRYL